jgi:hypothetical protein
MQAKRIPACPPQGAQIRGFRDFLVFLLEDRVG